MKQIVYDVRQKEIKKKLELEEIRKTLPEASDFWR